MNEIIQEYWKSYLWFDGYQLSGVAMTLWLLVASIAIGGTLAVPLAVARVSRNPLLRIPVWFYTYVFRGTPLYIQLLILYTGIYSLQIVRDQPALDAFFREGINDCAEVLVAALMDDREKHIFGRRTLPEMDMASLSCAIQNLWLAARVEGLGMGWVSLFEPQALADLLGLPAGAKPLAVLCLGPVEAFYPAPMLVLEGWAQARPLSELVYENYWGVSP